MVPAGKVGEGVSVWVEPHEHCLCKEWFMGKGVSIPSCDPAWVCVHPCVHVFGHLFLQPLLEASMWAVQICRSLCLVSGPGGAMCICWPGGAMCICYGPGKCMCVNTRVGII